MKELTPEETVNLSTHAWLSNTISYMCEILEKENPRQFKSKLLVPCFVIGRGKERTLYVDLKQKGLVSVPRLDSKETTSRVSVGSKVPTSKDRVLVNADSLLEAESFLLSMCVEAVDRNMISKDTKLSIQEGLERL